MAGHSQFANRKHRKERQDNKRGKIFTKLQKEIFVATKYGGGEPKDNPRLRSAILSAKRENMPKDKIDAAIKKGSGTAITDDYQQVTYEGYGVGGIAIIVTALTNNKHRTVSNIRTIFNKTGGSLGTEGSVNYMFSHRGLIQYTRENIDFERFFNFSLDQGVEDVEEEEELYTVLCDMVSFGALSQEYEHEFGEPYLAKLIWHPNEKIEIEEEKQEKLFAMFDTLEDDDDVQEIYHNANL